MPLIYYPFVYMFLRQMGFISVEHKFCIHISNMFYVCMVFVCFFLSCINNANMWSNVNMKKGAQWDVMYNFVLSILFSFIFRSLTEANFIWIRERTKLFPMREFSHEIIKLHTKFAWSMQMCSNNKLADMINGVRNEQRKCIYFLPFSVHLFNIARMSFVQNAHGQCV